MKQSTASGGREQLERRALERCGVVLRSDALAAGMSKAQIDRRVRRHPPRPVLVSDQRRKVTGVDVDGTLVAQVDLAWPHCRAAIELDSLEYHFDLLSFESDRRRDVEIGNQGWSVDRFTWRQYVGEWEWILDVVRRRLA